MKIPYKKILIVLVVFSFVLACSSNDNDVKTDDNISQTDDDPINGEDYEIAEVKILLPEDSGVNLSTSTLVSLGTDSSIDAKGIGKVPFNSGTVEVGYLLDEENKVLLAGFISEERKELSIETTAELMVYYALDYYLLPESGKSAFLKSIGQTPGFPGFVEEIKNLFAGNPTMYTEGAYQTALQGFLGQITSKRVSGLENRISFNDEKTKSGVTLSSVDSTTIKLQNSLPRRSRAIIYKKGYMDRNGEQFQLPNYTSSTFASFELGAGKSNTIKEMEVGNSLSQINAQQASIDNATATEPILLPVNPATELVAEYEVVVIGSGQPNSEERDMTAEERNIYAQINKKTYVMDYFLPTLLDVGGNKSLLPPFGSSKEDALVNAVLPILEQYPEVIDEVVNNEFKDATEIFLPALYGDVRLSNDLRKILGDVYTILSGNGDFPNTFIQSQELIETGYPRTKYILSVIDKNIKETNPYSNFGGLRTAAFNFERWDVKSKDAIVEFQGENIELCLGNATELRVTATTDYEPEVEDFEYHWSTSNKFGGRVQDIGDDSSNYGVSIITKKNYVSYISTATESQLGSGSNPETVTVVLYLRNKNTGELTEAGHDSIIVNNKKACESFTAGFTMQPNFRELNGNNNACSSYGGIEYQAFSPIPFYAEFKAVDGAIGYRGIIKSKGGTVSPERYFGLDKFVDIGGGRLRFTSGIGPIHVYTSCDKEKTKAKAQELLDNINGGGPASIELTPVF
ncbi:hypothetical protein ACNR9Q_07460 [Maribacter sp. X9]|uniref:hypothetical protein n=1 Tax=Maribacter sp. X9 TaxID=3402159 RepID=UPI003AF36A11